ncbi:PEP-CTERM sorting domain-containing protein [Thauera mechernichensis]
MKRLQLALIATVLSMMSMMATRAHADWVSLTIASGSAADIAPQALPWGGTFGTAAGLGALLYVQWDEKAGYARSEIGGGEDGFGIRTVRSFEIVVGPAGDVIVEIVGALEYGLNFAVTDPTNPGRSLASSIHIAQPLVTTLGPGLVQGAATLSAEARALSVANGDIDSEVVFSATPDDPVAAVATSMATGPSSGSVREVFDAWQLLTRHRVFIGDEMVSFDSAGATYDSGFGYALDNLDSTLFDFASGTGLLTGFQEHRFALANPGVYAVTLVDEFYGLLEHRQVPAPGTLLLVGLGLLALRWRHPS